MNLLIILVIAVIAYFIFLAPKNNKNVNILPTTSVPVRRDTTSVPVKRDTTSVPFGRRQRIPNIMRKR